jgi:hypothetical protein
MATAWSSFSAMRILSACIFCSLFDLMTEPMILDMVHHNPGERPYPSAFNDPATLKAYGYTGKVYFLFESPTLAINWESISPEILPPGSPDRAWVDAKAAWIRTEHAACRAAGMQIFAQTDMLLFPKRLVTHFQLQEQFGNPNDPVTQTLLRAQIAETFSQFPTLDGLVVRIGETYLHDAPFHTGSIQHKRDAQRTIIPLLQLLREEICVRHDRTLIFRSWYSFDQHPQMYAQIDAAVPPHPRLIIGIKHCEGDFHRANPFSRLIGQGRHRQIIEVQCAREYEGKGAYPNYIAHGVIEGFPEHQKRPVGRLRSIRDFITRRPDLWAGIWTWSRGGGWEGPYIRHELWPELNAWVLAQWAADPAQNEETIFYRYAAQKLKLRRKDQHRFRRLCLLSAAAVRRGINSTHRDMNPWWTRDQGISWPNAPLNPQARARNCREKDEAVGMWRKIVRLADTIEWPDEETAVHARGSCRYGLHLYEIYRALVYLAAAERENDQEAILHWIAMYDAAWEAYRRLPAQFAYLSTLYSQTYDRYLRNNAHACVHNLRADQKKERD